MSSWKDTFLNTPIEGKNEAHSIPPGAHTDESEIDPLFEIALDLRQSDFIDSIYDFWEERGYLTEKQFLALKRIVEGLEDYQ